MLFIRYGAIGCLCCGVLLLGGCGETTLHETWKSTRGLYYTYLNPPASIDYDDVGDLDASLSRLALNMRPIDEELTRFERYMMNQDKPPSPERVQALFERFPWVNGAVALSPEGEVLAQEPPTGMKPLDFTALVAAGTVNPHDLRGDVQMTPLGPEVLLGVPIFASEELKGYFVAHFDIRLLIDKVPDAANLIIMAPQGVLWPDGSGLAGQDWGKITKSRVSGTIDGHSWVCRYLGGVPLIFASPESDGSTAPHDAALPEQDEQTEPVDQTETEPAGQTDIPADADAGTEPAEMQSDVPM